MTSPSGLSAGDPPPRGVTRLGLFAYALAAAWIGLDQLSKFWILHVFDLPARGVAPVLPPIFNLSMVWNRGVSFGLLKAQVDLARWGLAAFSLVVAIALAVWARRLVRPLPALALGLIMGGAVGNLIDRVRLGAVADFLDFSGLYFPWVFNVADSGITVGVILLLLDSLVGGDGRKGRDGGDAFRERAAQLREETKGRIAGSSAELIREDRDRR